MKKFKIPPLPRENAKRRRILASALKVFSKEGYSGATMDAIALEAAVSKPTLYTYFGAKEKLFEAIMVAERDVMLHSFEHSSGNFVEDLHTFAWHYAETVMKAEFLSLARLIISEAQRFPAIGRAYQVAGPDRVLRGIMNYLQEQKEKGAVSFVDAELAAQDLWALILSAPRNHALHIPDEIPNRREIKRYVDNGLRVFLAAYSTNAAADITTLKTYVRKK